MLKEVRVCFGTIGAQNQKGKREETIWALETLNKNRSDKSQDKIAIKGVTWQSVNNYQGCIQLKCAGGHQR